MTLFHFIEIRHLTFLTGSFITCVRHEAGALIVYSTLLSEPAWNYTTSFSPGPDHLPSLLKAMRVSYQKMNRRLCISVHEKDMALLTSLKNSGFQVLFRDAWMIYHETIVRNKTHSHPFVTIKGLKRDLLKDDFVNVFLASYSKKSINDLYEFDPNNRAIIKQLLLEKSAHVKKGIVAYLEGVPVACGLIMMDSTVAGIYCIGVIHHARNQGIGEQIVNTLTQFALSKGIKSIFLQTESGSHLEKWYQKLGFITHFTTCYLVK